MNHQHPSTSARRSGAARSRVARSRSGIALITVLLSTVVVMLLVLTFSVVATTESRSVTSTASTERAVQIADAGSERARRALVDEFERSTLTIPNFLRLAGQDDIAGLAGVHEVTIDGVDVRWEVTDVSPPGSENGWIDVAATADDGQAVQTVVRRVGFGAAATFDLAMLSETTDCMFCHLRVRGDVGNLVFMRPGWGTEGGGGRCSGGSSGDSVIYGDVYAAQDVTRDCLGTTDRPELNGADVRDGQIDRFSRNPALPTDVNGDGVADFPPIDREVAMENATGVVGRNPTASVERPAVVRWVRDGETIGVGDLDEDGLPMSNLSGVSGVVDGNLVLIGTREDPIRIDGDVFVDGDIVLKGYVGGIGGLYAGRNIYLAGDVQVVNPPYYVSDGRCLRSDGSVAMTRAQLVAAAGGDDPDKFDDACAQRAMEDDTDALRLAARGSIIVGDYTEYDADGNLQTYSERQSADYYKQQFGFGGGARHRYDAETGDELRCDERGTCRNADGDVVTSHVELRGEEGYSASFRPGSVASDGFTSWMSDGAYQRILGTETYTHNTWRWQFPSAAFRAEQIGETYLQLVGTGLSAESALAVLDRKVNLDTPRIRAALETAVASAFPDPDDRPAVVDSIPHHNNRQNEYAATDDQGQEARFHWSGRTLRVIMAGEREYETQVNRVDAFLYANQRIAGKTSMQAMSITGGLVAKDLGILAPGRTLQGTVWSNDFATVDQARRNGDCNDPDSEHFVLRSEDCALTVNYDHRLRNGGYGFNIVQGQVGITLAWRLADDRSERVGH